MGNTDIKIIYWNEASKKLKLSNKALHDLMMPISRHLEDDRRNYFYQLDFNFGEKVIKEGQMTSLEKDKNGVYLNASKINFTPKAFSGKVQTDFQRFIEDCGQDTDHPLSVVTNGYIEIYCTQMSAYKVNNGLNNLHSYSFPLNIIEKGDLFGVWGSVNSIFNDFKRNYYGWNAVAGKTCIMPLMPGPEPKKSNLLYRNKFTDIFPDGPETPLQGIINLINKISDYKPFVEILIIPEIFYKSKRNENPQLLQAKLRLREYLYEVAWRQTKILREMVWDDKELMSALKINEADFVFHLIKHIINISSGNAFVLKPVSSNDGVLFKTFENLVEKFQRLSDRKGSLLDYTTPIFLHYIKLNNDNPRGIELAHSPSINLHLPPTNAETMRDNIMFSLFKTHKLSNYLKTLGYDVSLKYFKEIPKSKTHGAANSDGYVIDLNQYIEKDLTELYSPFLPGGFKVKLPKTPSLFNSFIHIERTNW